MSDPEIPSQPLLGTPSQQPAGGSSSRAYKVAGITLLACVLIVGQAMTAYFLLSQRSDIKSLEDQSNDLKHELTKGRSASVPMRMHVPMNALPAMMADSVDEVKHSEASTGTPEKNTPPQATDCQLEAAGVKETQLPDFRPSCDQRGLYTAQQCFKVHCWCVNPVNGQAITGSLRQGPASCGRAAVRSGETGYLVMKSD
ncbi:hypothetical protein L3Q82_012019 [Scortum barcoo]|uniref:Uncharacterized protein n=1 Tax=Scortum barcoo TaxID=214431 RepID=A0ACB8W7I9_9TELE|nr:hypothetical protein L3Q82_012019 [Scortum barcoo]